jgi:hypothetical protein
LALNGLHGVISQELILFITTAVKTKNPTIHNERLHSMYFSPKIRVIESRNEMGGTCGTHGRDEHTKPCLVHLKGREHSKDLGVEDI